MEYQEMLTVIGTVCLYEIHLVPVWQEKTLAYLYEQSTFYLRDSGILRGCRVLYGPPWVGKRPQVINVGRYIESRASVL